MESKDAEKLLLIKLLPLKIVQSVSLKQMDILKELNEVQGKAVTTIDGPVMIIAGPGSGKTRVLTFRIAYLISQKIDPFRILALTFTNKASAEMRERIQQLVGGEARNLFMGTFHSVFARILRMEATKLGYPQNFTIYDTDDAKSLLKSIIKEQGLNDKIYKPSNVFFRISSAKNSLISPADYRANPDLVSEDEISARPLIGFLYEEYQKRMFRAGAMDFDDLLMKMYELLENFPEVCYKYQHRFSHIMIDEFQDTNYAQYAIVKRLSEVNENICVVGDDAQSIYAFRGATIANILNFEKHFPDLKVYKLEQNYRSTPFIVHAANQVISNNKSQLKKTIWTDKDTGEKIKVFRTGSESEEGRLVADSIFELKMRNHLRNMDFAILYRTNAQSRALEESLRKLNIAYRIYGGLSFYQRKEIKDFVAYLRTIVNPHDEEAIKRIINYPKRAIGNTTVDKMIVGAQEQGVSLWHMVKYPEQIPEVNRGTYQSVKNFGMMIQSFQAQLKHKNAYEIAELVGRQTGLLDDLYRDKTAEGLSRYENVQELLNGIKQYTTQEKPALEEDEVAPESDLAAYLQQISLLTDQDGDDKDPDKVKLMTIHAAKGLEFPAVFVVGLEENLFPSMMSMNTRDDLEEERRLFYVAITRAEKHLTLSYATSRYKFGSLQFNEPSRFIEEIGSGNVEFLGGRMHNTPPTPSFPRQEQTAMPWYKSKVNQQSKPEVAKPVASNSGDRPAELTRVSKAVQSSGALSSDLKNLQTGAEVLHEKFGVGKVVKTEGAGDNRMAEIFFEQHGQKKILLRFAKLQILS
jgi:DNA helicase II / ATP-dependent DNA helicase PcrA